MSDVELQIVTGRENRPVIGMDTLIASMPAQFYVDIGGQPTLAVRVFTRWLRQFSETSAANLEKELHHAEYVITTSPVVVQARGAMHDCETCRAGVRVALRRLQRDPEHELLVGSLYWAG